MLGEGQVERRGESRGFYKRDGRILESNRVQVRFKTKVQNGSGEKIREDNRKEEKAKVKDKQRIGEKRDIRGDRIVGEEVQERRGRGEERNREQRS